jgi:hypothetical protein
MGMPDSVAISLIKNPPRAARVGTRWWWYGGAVEKAEITRELNAMREAGLGGVEIQFLYPLDFDDPAAGQRHVDYFSPEFFELLDYTIITAKGMDLEVDLTLGAGWPFGGSFVEDTMAPDILVPFSHDVTGPCTFSFDYTCVLPGEIERVVLVNVSGGAPDAENARDITSSVKPTFIETWRWGSRLEAEIPEGPHKIFTFVVQKYKQNVGKPAPNMQGLAIDHCRREVSDFYFRTMGDTLIERLGRGRIRSFFCDSNELGGCNWTKPCWRNLKGAAGTTLRPGFPRSGRNWGNHRGRPLRLLQYLFRIDAGRLFSKLHPLVRFLGVTSRTQAHGTWATF